jgi:hypothetical protein
MDLFHMHFLWLFDYLVDYITQHFFELIIY